MSGEYIPALQNPNGSTVATPSDPSHATLFIGTDLAVYLKDSTGTVRKAVPATNGTLGQALTSDGAGGFSTPVTLGTTATQNANAVAITGGTLSNVSMTGAYRIGVNDTRNVYPVPNLVPFGSTFAGVVYEFKSWQTGSGLVNVLMDAPGLSPVFSIAAQFALCQTIQPWGDSTGGAVTQSAIGLTDNISYIRQSNPSAAFGNLNINYTGMWKPSTAYSAGQIVSPVAGFTYWGMVCSTAGTSGATEPTWPTTTNGTVTDGSVTWTAINFWNTWHIRPSTSP